MNIGFDAKRAYMNRTGLGNYSRSLIEGFLDLFPQNQYFVFTPKLSDLFDARGAMPIVPGFAMPEVLANLWRIFYVAAEAKKKEIAIFHGLTNELPAGLNRRGIKQVVTVHDLIFLRYPHLYWNPFDRWIYRKKTDKACRIADKIVAISSQTKEDLVNFLHIPEEKIEIIWQDCHPRFRKEISQEQKIEVKKKYALPETFLLSVGTIEERKNHILILKALRALKEIPLVLVGKPTAYKKILLDFIRDNRLEKQVRFLEDIHSDDLPVLYALADIFIYPSIFEGFGIPVLEALNTKTPVITATGSCFEETGGQAAEYVNPRDSEELAQKIKWLLENSSMRDSMREKGMQHALRFRREENLPKLMKMYESLK